MKIFVYIGKEQQLLDRGFKMQIEQSGNVNMKYAWRDFKCKNESIIILLFSDLLKDYKLIRQVRALNNHAKNHLKIKDEISDLIESNLVKVEEIDENSSQMGS